MTFAVERHAAIPLRPNVDVVEQLLEASRARRVLDCRAGDARSIISADDVRRACLSSSAEGDPFGLRLANAAIAGILDLRAATVAGPLHFAACTFARAPRVDGADLHELSITDGRHGGTTTEGVLASSRVPGLLANGVRIRRDLQLSGSVITGAHATSASLSRTSAIWLTEAQIGGRLLAVGTRIEASGHRAMQCDRTQVSGDIRLIRGFTANREIRLIAVELEGSLDLRAARLSAPDGRALDMAEANIGGSLFLIDDDAAPATRPQIRGRVDMSRATIRGRLLIRNADLHAPPAGQGQHHYDLQERSSPTFLLAPRLTVGGELVVEGQTNIHGALRLPSADLRGVVRLSNVRLHNEFDIALDLSHAQLGSALLLPHARVSGALYLANAQIAGRIDVRGSQITSPGRHRCIFAIGVASGEVGLRRVTATGGSLDFRGATIRGNVDAEGAELSNPVGHALSLNQARVTGNVRLCGGFSSVGLVVLSRAVVEGRLRCDGATLAWPDNAAELAIGVPEDEREPNVLGSAFEAISAVVRSGIGLGWAVRSGGVDFTDARTSYLADDPTNWPDQSHLVGFTYERFAPLDMKSGRHVRDARIRRAWLDRLPYDPQPWEQAAKVLRANGDETGAEEILIAQRRRARRERIGLRERPLRYVWDAMKDRFVGYGYRPQRALFVLVGLIAVVAGLLMLPGPRASMTAVEPLSVVTADDSVVRTAEDHCHAGKVRCFEPVLYAFDTVVPLIDLGQRSTWYASGPGGRALGWVLNLCTGIGWFFSTIAALSFARLARSS